MKFEPIAIVGRACHVPGASSPEELFELVDERRVVTSAAPEGRWRLPKSDVLTTQTDPASARDKAWTDVGAYVEIPALQSRGLHLNAAEAQTLTPIETLLLETGRAAFEDAGFPEGTAGAVVGNLSLPTESQSRYAERVWLGESAAALDVADAHPRGRFSSGGPARTLARGLGLSLGGYALDAACASSLYAIELACRQLHRREAHVMLAGAISRCDDLFIHVGFCALGAMSKTGQSRPFHREADGLIPGEGCGMVALMRLSDARAEGRKIHGVIRGVGLSNDGRGANLLAPSPAGQALSMKRALEQSGLAPESVPYIECHATGTPVGDGVELKSMRAAYGDAPKTIGSLKGNIGHLITAAGVAGLIKLLECFERRTMPATPSVDGATHDAFADSPMQLLHASKPWEGPRRAGLSAFGFGGNNGHLIVEAADETPASAQAAAEPAPKPVVVVGLGAIAGSAAGISKVHAALSGADHSPRIEEVALPFKGLKFPPATLKLASGQQTALLAACLEAEASLGVALTESERESLSVFAGYGCDPEIARWGARWRAPSWAKKLGHSEDWARKTADALAPSLLSEHVVGVLPNIPANRLSSQLDARGPSHTVSEEAGSGLRALQLAVERLALGEGTFSLACAVDRSTEAVHESIVGGPSGDAAIAMLVMREEDALARGLRVIARIMPAPATGQNSAHATSLGVAHNAHGLLEICASSIAKAPQHVEWAGRAFHVEPVSAEALLAEAIAKPNEKSLTLPARWAPVSIGSSPASNPSISDSPNAVSISSSNGAALAARNQTPMTHSKNPQAPSASMSRAPALPPTTFAPEVAPAAPTFAPSAPAPVAPAVAASPSSVAASLSGAATTGASHPNAMVRHHAKLVAAHQAFIAQQSELHAEFMNLIATAPNASAPTIAAAPAAVRVTQGAKATPLPAHLPAGMPIAPSKAKAAPAPVAPSLKKPMPRLAPETPAASKPAPSKPVASKPAPKANVLAAKPAKQDENELPLAFRPEGPSFSREDLLTHASGVISNIFGELFEQQDGHAVQVRMPEPPLLLADRCTGMKAEPGGMLKSGASTRGTCWTETDVKADSWYLNNGHMPTGIMVESGQADLFLISYLGADFLNQGERAYRLLGCEMTWLGDLPKVGETLAYDIHVDGHAKQGDVRLFFFHYDCYVRRADGSIRPALRVRHGQAGFFTRAELDESAGILWKAEEQEILENARLDAPAKETKTSFTKEEVIAFSEGRPWDCFGESFERTKTHTRTPQIQDGRMRFFDEVDVFDPKGGPWGRGYLRATQTIDPNHWFFDGHFKNDPCMPGTLMLEGCVQAMTFYLCGLGYSLDRDGWRFQPVQDETYKLICRGQVTPESKKLTYELFVEEVHDGPIPTLYADLLCTVDGLGAFHARRFALQMVPSWPNSSFLPEKVETDQDDRCAVESCKLDFCEGEEPFRFDQNSLIACAWGQPSTAFGPMYERFDGTRRTPRLPGPPYHFISRVTKTPGVMGQLAEGKSMNGIELEFEYDIPADAWYFDENGCRVMPFAVLLEAALQPCGWTASYVGSTLTNDDDFLFRNLDGTGTIKAEIFEVDAGQAQTLRTEVRVKNVSQSAGMIIESFEVHCFIGETEVYELDTVFGFFPPSAFENQAGLPASDEQKAFYSQTGNIEIDVAKTARAAAPEMAPGKLLMIDRVTYFEADGGREGLGCVRAEKDIDAGEWFFKAHFYQDPVQPGSLGIEAMLQAMQWGMRKKGLHSGMKAPRFEAIASAAKHVWKYRGQVVPENKLVSTTLEFIEIRTDERGVLALADCSLWVDGKRIYEAKGLGMRIVDGPDRGPEGKRFRKSSAFRGDADGLALIREGTSALEAPKGSARSEAPTSVARRPMGIEGSREVILDSTLSPWLADHCPTYSVPALPMMSIVDRMMAHVRAELGALAPSGLSEFEVLRWVTIGAGGTRTKTELSPVEGGAQEVRFLVWRDAKNPKLSRFEVAARALVKEPELSIETAPGTLGAAAPPYAEDRLFHGPAFFFGTELRRGAKESLLTLDASKGFVPHGELHQGLLDAATHGIPHDSLSEWTDGKLGEDVVAYPRQLDIRLLRALPTEGKLFCHSRFAGFADERNRMPVFEVRLFDEGGDIAYLRLVEIAMPKGPLGQGASTSRRAFLRDGEPNGLSLSRVEGEETLLDAADVAASDWLPGTLRHVYRAKSEDLTRELAIREHAGRLLSVHPRELVLSELDDATLVQRVDAPLTGIRVQARRETSTVRVRSLNGPSLELKPVEDYWRSYFGLSGWPVEDIYYGLSDAFVDAVHLDDPAAHHALYGKSVLYLANHQTGIESLTFSILASGLHGVPTLTLAKKEHRESWLGKLIAHCFSWPGVQDPGVITYFDREDPASLPRIVQKLKDTSAAKSLMVHVEGTRAQSARKPVETMSGVFCDLAIGAGVHIVPVRFSGGLPIDESDTKLEFPVGFGKQTIHLGAPISPEMLSALPYKDRTKRVIEAINGLGTPAAQEVPARGNEGLASNVSDWRSTLGDHPLAVIPAVLEAREKKQPLSQKAQELLRALRQDAPSEDTWVSGLLSLLREE